MRVGAWVSFLGPSASWAKFQPVKGVLGSFSIHLSVQSYYSSDTATALGTQGCMLASLADLIPSLSSNVDHLHLRQKTWWPEKALPDYGKNLCCVLFITAPKDWCSFMVPYGFPGINQLPWRHHAHQERSSPWQAVLCPEKKAQPEGDTTLVNRISSKEEMRHPGEQHLFLTVGSQVEWSSVW